MLENLNLIPLIMRSLKNLPPFPMVAQRALQLLNQPEVSIQELVEVVKFDPAITANVLRISNSAFFGMRREIHSLHQALLLLGTQELLKIIIASGATRLFVNAVPGYFSDRRGLWRHSISCALMADHLARELAVGDRTTSFTAGLLHDIGKLVLSLYVTRSLRISWSWWKSRASPSTRRRKRSWEWTMPKWGPKWPASGISPTGCGWSSAATT